MFEDKPETGAGGVKVSGLKKLKPLISQTEIDKAKIWEAQMKEWKAKFHELKLGKPMYDLFICDKAVNSRDYFN